MRLSQQTKEMKMEEKKVRGAHSAYFDEIADFPMPMEHKQPIPAVQKKIDEAIFGERPKKKGGKKPLVDSNPLDLHNKPMSGKRFKRLERAMRNGGNVKAL
jgi:hypothetical protein